MDYKQRMKEEYDRLCERITKLDKMLDGYDAGTLDFMPSCPYWLLSKQYDAMVEYKEILEARNYIEGAW